MRAFGGNLRRNWLPVTALIASTAFVPIAASGGQYFYRAYLTASATIVSGGAQLSVSRAPLDASSQASSSVTINSHGAAPYTFFLTQHRNAAPDSSGDAEDDTSLAFCRDAACKTVWAPDGDPQTGIVVTPGSVSTALPLSVMRSANADDDGHAGSVVTLTMYF